MNYKSDILDRLKGQQPVIDNPEELTDSIMNSLPEQDAPVEKQERRSRLVPMAWRWVAAAACLLLIIGVGVSYQFSDSPQAISQNSTDLHNKLHGLSQQTPRTFTTNSTDFHDKVHGLLPQSPRTSEKESTDSSSTRRSQPVDPVLQHTDPNVHYAHHSTATSEDTTYLAPSLVDDFIAKFANYYKVTPVAMNCADDSTETRVVSNAYVFPDKEEVNDASEDKAIQPINFDERLFIVMGLDEVPEVDSVSPITFKVVGHNDNGDIYNMHGQKVGDASTRNRLPKGVYISNNKKFVIE